MTALDRFALSNSLALSFVFPLRLCEFAKSFPSCPKMELLQESVATFSPLNIELQLQLVMMMISTLYVRSLTVDVGE